MTISAIRLMSLVAEAVKPQPVPQAKSDPATVALVKALAVPALAPETVSGAAGAPVLPASLSLAQSTRPQQDGSAAVLRAYDLASAEVPASVDADEQRPGRQTGGAADPLLRAEMPPAPRAAESAAANRSNPLPWNGFAVLPFPTPAAGGVRKPAKSEPGQAGRKTAQNAPAPREAAESDAFRLNRSLALLAAAAAAVALALALILAF